MSIAQEYAQCEPQFKGKVRLQRNDIHARSLHSVRMVRKPRHPGWYVKEWLAAKGLRQADVVARTPFNKGQVSEYVNGSRRWNEDVLREFAHAIGVDDPLLLRPPGHVENEISAYVMRMDSAKRAQALRIMKALAEEEAA